LQIMTAGADRQGRNLRRRPTDDGETGATMRISGCQFSPPALSGACQVQQQSDFPAMALLLNILMMPSLAAGRESGPEAIRRRAIIFRANGGL
jgi:hypothetical protein